MARNRYLRIILLPLLGIIFMIGWILAYLGEQNAQSKKSRKKSIKIPDETLEIGMLAKVGEESPLIENSSKKDKANN